MSTAQVLVVDGDVGHGASVRDLLREHGYSVELETNGGRCLQRIRSEAIDVLILDLDMPDRSSVDVLQALKLQNTPPETIVISGTSQVETVAPILRLGPHDYLAKPYDPEQLLASVHSAMARTRCERERRAEAERKDAESRRDAWLVDASPDLIYTLDAQGRFTFLNSQLTDLFTPDRGGLIGVRWPALVGDELAATLRYQLDERRTGQRATHQQEFRYLDAHGTCRVIELSARGLYHGSRPSHAEFAGTYGVLRDITARKQSEQDRLDLEVRLRQARELAAIGQLAGGIAHDFNNILASIIGYTELSLDASADPDSNQAQGYLHQVIAAGQRARDLVSQILTFTHVHRGNPVSMKVGASVREVCRLLRTGLRQGIELVTTISEAEAEVGIDASHLQQIVLNLLNHARNAVAGGGRIDVRVARITGDGRCAGCDTEIVGDFMEIAVIDSGPGISADTLPHIFDRSVAKRAPGGVAGNGLWLSRALVHEYDGHVDAASSLRGTTVRILLPTAASRCDTEAGVTLGPRLCDALPSGHILVVDDEVSIGNFIGETLREAGYRAVVFEDSVAASDHLCACHAEIALVLCGQIMPHVSGLEIAALARSLPHPPPVVIMTGYADREQKPSIEALGDVRLLGKPFRIDELLTAVREAARHRDPPAP